MEVPVPDGFTPADAKPSGTILYLLPKRTPAELTHEVLWVEIVRHSVELARLQAEWVRRFTGVWFPIF
jgi:hypothetical protein